MEAFQLGQLIKDNREDTQAAHYAAHLCFEIAQRELGEDLTRLIHKCDKFSTTLQYKNPPKDNPIYKICYIVDKAIHLTFNDIYFNITEVTNTEILCDISYFKQEPVFLMTTFWIDFIRSLGLTNVNCGGSSFLNLKTGIYYDNARSFSDLTQILGFRADLNNFVHILKSAHITIETNDEEPRFRQPKISKEDIKNECLKRQFISSNLNYKSLDELVDDIYLKCRYIKNKEEDILNNRLDSAIIGSIPDLVCYANLKLGFTFINTPNIGAKLKDFRNSNITEKKLLKDINPYLPQAFIELQHKLIIHSTNSKDLYILL